MEGDGCNVKMLVKIHTNWFAPFAFPVRLAHKIAGIVNEFPDVPLGVINQSELEEIAGELSIFTVPVDLIYFNGKEMHRQGRFIDMQQFEHQLTLMYKSMV